MAAINAEGELPTLSGISDLYSYSLAYLLAGGNQWNPRPVFQSYQSYGDLALRNARHLEGADAPENLFVKVEAIDQHYPTMEDGPSWPRIMTRYSPSKVENDTLILRRLPPRNSSSPRASS